MIDWAYFLFGIIAGWYLRWIHEIFGINIYEKKKTSP